MEESGATISAEGERANLADETGGASTGVATREGEGEMTTYMVLASLPDPENGNYYAWIDNGDETYTLVGMMSPAKGGYLIEKQVEAASEGQQAVVSLESQVGEAPTNVVLRGSF